MCEKFFVCGGLNCLGSCGFTFMDLLNQVDAFINDGEIKQAENLADDLYNESDFGGGDYSISEEESDYLVLLLEKIARKQIEAGTFSMPSYDDIAI
jgi:hypothetical protein